ncbi:MAG: DUF4424 domain-containing protein [Treponema sp.]|jgi:hypothetical protein|nr:DUF4424 domain-containing protein [Treponema sp.]
MRKNICILLFFFINISISANDGRVVNGPSIHLLDDENTNVRMQSEVINITIHEEYYEVRVEFDFYNEGPDETVLIGFPVISWSFADIEYFYRHDNIFGFKSYINGELISEYIIKEEEDNDYRMITWTKWYMREVLFPEKTHTYSTVTYCVRNQFNYFIGDTSVGYFLGTGRSWKDKIGKITIHITHNDDVFIWEIRGMETFDFTWEANGKYTFEIENIKPEINDSISIGIVRPDNFLNDYFPHKYHPGYNNKKELLYKDENDIQYYTINQIRSLLNLYFNDQEYEFDEVDIKNVNYLLRLRNKIPNNTKKISISISIWIILIIFVGCILTVCLLFYAIKKIKYIYKK